MVKEEKKEEKSLAVYNDKRLEENAKLGMSKVDPTDIRPPQILLVQKSSELDDFVDKDGKTAKIGQFFHSGRTCILNDFECYIIYAAKSKYIDRRKPEQGEKDQYKALGVMSDDYSLFGMTFRSSALFTLSKLFSSCVSTKRPMFSFLCKIEVKMLSGEKGDWYIPVLRIVKQEADPEKLIFLEEMAKNFDMKAESLTGEDFDDIEDSVKQSEPVGAV
jgi:hypothetical protein